MEKKLRLLTVLLFAALSVFSRGFHVSVSGNDSHEGSVYMPLKTISAASKRAFPSDTIVVHAGIYRKWVNPSRGGLSNDQRIVYTTAEGEEVEIRGSERITGWDKRTETVWSVKLSNSFFGNYNPYKELISGDWFWDKGCKVAHACEWKYLLFWGATLY